MRDRPVPGHGGVQDRRVLPLHPLSAPRGRAVVDERDGRPERSRGARGRGFGAATGARRTAWPKRSVRSVAGTSGRGSRASETWSGCASGRCTGTRGSSRSGASGWNPRRTGIRSRTTVCRVSRNVGKPEVEHRQLGASGLSVSVLSLGSWRTWERDPARGRDRDAAGGSRRRHRPSGHRPLPRRRRPVRDRVRRDLPRVRLAARRGDDRQQAVVGVLAGAERRGGDRRVTAANRARLLRLHLLRPAADRARRWPRSSTR